MPLNITHYERLVLVSYPINPPRTPTLREGPAKPYKNQSLLIAQELYYKLLTFSLREKRAPQPPTTTPHSVICSGLLKMVDKKNDKPVHPNTNTTQHMMLWPTINGLLKRGN